eukprot:jgi/Mesen1/8382/ME000468S07825
MGEGEGEGGGVALRCFVTRELQALMQEVDVEMVMQHVVGTAEAFHNNKRPRARLAHTRQVASTGASPADVENAIASAARPFVFEQAIRFGAEVARFLRSGLSIPAYDEATAPPAVASPAVLPPQHGDKAGSSADQAAAATPAFVLSQTEVGASKPAPGGKAEQLADGDREPQEASPVHSAALPGVTSQGLVGRRRPASGREKSGRQDAEGNNSNNSVLAGSPSGGLSEINESFEKISGGAAEGGTGRQTGPQGEARNRGSSEGYPDSSSWRSATARQEAAAEGARKEQGRGARQVASEDLYGPWEGAGQLDGDDDDDWSWVCS